jgi:hypothetical protein
LSFGHVSVAVVNLSGLGFSLATLGRSNFLRGGELDREELIVSRLARSDLPALEKLVAKFVTSA